MKERKCDREEKKGKEIPLLSHCVLVECGENPVLVRETRRPEQ